MPKTFYQGVRHFRTKNSITEFFYILLIVSTKKIGGHHASFPTIRDDRSFWSKFRTRMSS
jgi:hypothetical protein